MLNFIFQQFFLDFKYHFYIKIKINIFKYFLCGKVMWGGRININL
jgi:hypothetical protein